MIVLHHRRHPRRYKNKISERWRWFSKGPIWAVNKTGFGTGFCGSCTTFSSWSFHAAKGYQSGQLPPSAIFQLDLIFRNELRYLHIQVFSMDTLPRPFLAS
mmetsp:Transcript_3009/g.4717  ORF Transcript_3009/g.4717 Transcript_3009/m.4717 type:complete len:101 (-) Transcript_3009:49-351(-)